MEQATATTSNRRNDMTYADLTAADTAADVRADFEAFYASLTITEQRVLRENPTTDISDLLATLEGDLT